MWYHEKEQEMRYIILRQLMYCSDSVTTEWNCALHRFTQEYVRSIGIPTFELWIPIFTALNSLQTLFLTLKIAIF